MNFLFRFLGRRSGKTPRTRNAYCSFCRKSYLDVGPLAEGPADVYICGKCAAVCLALIENENARRQALKPAEGISN
jgi:ATP-dependent Clp protease ATP-binding subunit ClpX